MWNFCELQGLQHRQLEVVSNYYKLLRVVTPFIYLQLHKRYNQGKPNFLTYLQKLFQCSSCLFTGNHGQNLEPIPSYTKKNRAIFAPKSKVSLQPSIMIDQSSMKLWFSKHAYTFPKYYFFKMLFKNNIQEKCKQILETIISQNFSPSWWRAVRTPLILEWKWVWYLLYMKVSALNFVCGYLLPVTYVQRKLE